MKYSSTVAVLHANLSEMAGNHIIKEAHLCVTCVPAADGNGIVGFYLKAECLPGPRSCSSDQH